METNIEKILESNQLLLTKISNKFSFKIENLEIIHEFASVYLSQEYEKDFMEIKKSRPNHLILPKQDDYYRVRLLGNKKVYEDIIVPSGVVAKTLSKKTKKVQIFTLSKKKISTMPEENFNAVLRLLFIFVRSVKNVQNIISIQDYESSLEMNNHESFIQEALEKELI